MPEFQKGAAFTHSFDVSAQVYRGFIETFKDRNLFHMDDEAARDKGFAHKVMHGNILCGFLSYFVGECLPIKSVLIHSEEIQFHKPVYLNDTVTIYAVIADCFESVSAAEIKFHFENQHKDKVAKGKVRVGII